MSWKTAILPVLFLLAIPFSCAAGEDVEAQKPKRTLTPDQQQQANELLEKIKAEKARLAEVRKPLDEVMAQYNEPKKQMNIINGAAGKISTIISDNNKELKKEDIAAIVKDKIKPESDKMGNFGDKYLKLAQEMLEAQSDVIKDKDDAKKKEAAAKKVSEAKDGMKKALEAGTDKLSAALDKLEPKRRAEEDKFREESVALGVLRDKLRLLYGYDVQNATALFTAESGVSGDAEMMAWIDEQGLLISRLSAFGYEDLADRYFDIIKAAPNPFTGKPFNDEARNYLNKVNAKLLLQKATTLKDLRARLQMGQEAVDLYREVVARMLPQTPMHLDAVTELANAEVSVADAITDLIYNNAGSGPLPAVASLPKKAAPAAKPDPKAAPAPAAAAAPAKFTAESLAKLDDKALMQAAVEYASTLYADAIAITKPLQEGLADTYLDLIDEYLEAQESKNRSKEAKAFRNLNKLGVQKNRLQHATESAYAGWPVVFSPDNPARKELVRAANELYEANLQDYVDTWVSDKQAYGHWMLICASLPDPVLEKGEGGKDLPRFDKGSEEEWKEMSAAEQRAEQRNITRYAWASDRVDNIFNWYLVGDKQKGVADKSVYVQNGRMTGLVKWAAARMRMALDAHRLADAQTDAAKKTALQAYAEKMDARVVEAVEEFNKPVTLVGPLDATTKCKGLLEIGNQYYMLMAARAITAGEKDKAEVFVKQALTCAAAARSAGEGYWRNAAGEALLAINAFRQKNQLNSGDDPESWMPAMLLTQAEACFRDGLAAERGNKKAEAEKQFTLARYYYIILTDKARRLTKKEKRDEVLPKALYNLGAAAVKVGDLDTAFIANQALAQEFRNDFADPALNYPPQQFPNAAKYYPLALNNLRATGFMMTKKSKSPFQKKNYIDALMMNVRASGKGEDYVALINTLANEMKEYENAVAFIEGVPEDNDYYRITQLMASSIYVTMIQKAKKELEANALALNPIPNEDGKIPEDKVLTAEAKAKLVKRQEELNANLKQYRAEATRYANLFIELHKKAVEKWSEDAQKGVKVTAAVQNIRNQEKINLLQAMLIPLSLAFESGEYDAVLKQIPQYYAAVDAQKDVPAEEKLSYRQTAAWVAFNAQFRKADYAKDELAACAKNLEASQEAQAELAKVDPENRYQSDVASLLGGAWLKLSGRAKEKGQLDAEKQYAITAVNWLDKAESRIYEQVGTGIKMGATLTEQKLYDRAENVLDKVILFWGEARYTPMSLYQPGQSAAGMKQMAPEVAGLLGTTFAADKIATAAATGNDALVAQLNTLVSTVKLADNGESALKALDAAVEANKGNGKLVKALEEGRRFLQGLAAPDKSLEPFVARLPHLKPAMTPSDDQRYRINRLLLTAAYPKALYLQQAVPMIPSPVQLLKQTQILDRNYASTDGRKKAAVMVAMMAPVLLTESQRAVVFGERAEQGAGGMVAELNKQLEESKSETEKQKLQMLLANLNMPLLVSVYGTPDSRGRLINRSYGRARATIASILSYDQDVASDETFPIRDFLRELDQALAFENMILYAKKDYARAMVENGSFAKAEKYVQDLCLIFPNDWSLQLDLGDIYTSMASYSGAGAKRVKVAYSEEAAKRFQQGYVQYVRILNTTKPGTEPYWASYMKLLENEVTGLEARLKGPQNLKEGYELKYQMFDLSSGTLKPAGVKIPPVAGDNGKGKTLANNIYRLTQKADPKPSDEDAAKMQSLLERLAKLGFTPKVVSEKELEEMTAEN